MDKSVPNLRRSTRKRRLSQRKEENKESAVYIEELDNGSSSSSITQKRTTKKKKMNNGNKQLKRMQKLPESESENGYHLAAKSTIRSNASSVKQNNLNFPMSSAITAKPVRRKSLRISKIMPKSNDTIVPVRRYSLRKSTVELKESILIKKVFAQLSQKHNLVKKMFDTFCAKHYIKEIQESEGASKTIDNTNFAQKGKLSSEKLVPSSDTTKGMKKLNKRRTSNNIAKKTISSKNVGVSLNTEARTVMTADAVLEIEKNSSSVATRKARSVKKKNCRKVSKNRKTNGKKSTAKLKKMTKKEMVAVESDKTDGDSIYKKTAKQSNRKNLTNVKQQIKKSINKIDNNNNNKGKRIRNKVTNRESNNNDDDKGKEDSTTVSLNKATTGTKRGKNTKNITSKEKNEVSKEKKVKSKAVKEVKVSRSEVFDNMPSTTAASVSSNGPAITDKKAGTTTQHGNYQRYVPRKFTKSEMKDFLKDPGSILNTIDLKEILSLKTFATILTPVDRSILYSLLPECERNTTGIVDTFMNNVQFKETMSLYQTYLSGGVYEASFMSTIRSRRRRQPGGWTKQHELQYQSDFGLNVSQLKSTGESISQYEKLDKELQVLYALGVSGKKPSILSVDKPKNTIS